jgi:TonB family protein
MNTILGKKPEQEEINRQKEKISAVLRNSRESISIEKALIISAIAHPLVVFLGYFLTFLVVWIFSLFNIHLTLFEKPEPKPKDIEFVIVNKPDEQPINKNTKLRSDRNSRAGGKNDPTRKISPPEDTSVRSTPQKASAPSKPSPPPKIVRRPERIQKQQETPPRPQMQEESPKTPPRPIPQKRSSIPRPTPLNPLSVPVPPPKVTEPDAQVGGPVTTGPIASSSSSSNTSPSPIMSPNSGTGSQGSNLRRPGSYSPGGGDMGNPGPGNPYGAPGVDAIKEPDFGPYMRELQRRIKKNWNPPRGNESKRVILLFKVSRDGQLLSLRVYKSSSNPENDKAAVQAVRDAAPFRPLPPEYKGRDVDIQFTFDYNVFGIGQAQMMQ